MNEQTKESKFLDAINKYAEQQKAQITQDIEDYKKTKIEQATEQGLQDAYDLIRDDIRKRKAAIVNEVSREELKLRNELFEQRQTICDDVFAQARQKLLEFVKSPEYTAFLERSLNEVKDTVGDKFCKVHLSQADCSLNLPIDSILPSHEVVADRSIMIGGVKVYCPELGILMDDTLDARLNDQLEWFTENSGLKVV